LGRFIYTVCMKIYWLLITLLWPFLAYSHGGGLDAYGCHHDRKQGNYHCHRGPNTGKYYSSKVEMQNSSVSNKSNTSQSKPIKDKSATTSTLHGKVVGITDGDTLTLLVGSRQYKIRLAEIDTPERRQPYGTKARQELSELAFGKEIIAKVQDIDRYGRTVARLYVDDIDISAELVRRSAAWVYRQYVTDKSLYDIEKEARIMSYSKSLD